GPGGREDSVPLGPRVLGQEAADLGLQVFVPIAGGAEPGRPVGGVDADRGLEELADPSPAFRSHRCAPASWPTSQARATRQSPPTSPEEPRSAAAPSATATPPKSRRVMPWACRPLSSASRSNASWTPKISRPSLWK